MVKPESKTLIASTVDHIFVPLSWSQDSLQQSAFHSYFHHLKASHSTTDLVTSLSPWGVRGQGGRWDCDDVPVSAGYGKTINGGLARQA